MGTLAAALALCTLSGLGEMFYAHFFIGTLSFFDRAGTMEEYVGDGGFQLWPYKYFFVAVVPALLLALVWAKPWPRGVRDPAAAVVLCLVQQASLYQVPAAPPALHNMIG